jgi:hypothetical protein
MWGCPCWRSKYSDRVDSTFTHHRPPPLSRSASQALFPDVSDSEDNSSNNAGDVEGGGVANSKFPKSSSSLKNSLSSDVDNGNPENNSEEVLEMATIYGQKAKSSRRSSLSSHQTSSNKIQNNFSNPHSNALLLDTSVRGSYKPVSK